MRKIWLGIVGAVVCLGLGLAVVGCSSSTTPDNGMMGGDKMSGNKMAGDEKAGDKMAGDKVAGDKMAGDKMAGDKMDKK
jgi:pentapeptide MXKDX repeat protein